jgi:1-deoxy-D-xylulose-5-phosphate synthase
MEIGKGIKIRDGNEIALVTIGHVGNYGISACEALEKEGISPAHYNMRFLKPIDSELLHEVFGRFKKIITVEDGTIIGGLGSALLEFMSDHGYHAQVRRMGIPDHFVEQGTLDELHRECRFDTEGIILAVKSMLGKTQ